jgi:hypothetical protein
MVGDSDVPPIMVSESDDVCFPSINMRAVKVGELNDRCSLSDGCVCSCVFCDWRSQITIALDCTVDFDKRVCPHDLIQRLGVLDYIESDFCNVQCSSFLNVFAEMETGDKDFTLISTMDFGIVTLHTEN